jgi:hypothetical protein
VDLFPDWEAGIKKVIRAVKAGPKPRFGQAGCRLVQTPI